MADEVDLAVVTMLFDAVPSDGGGDGATDERLLSVLAKYVVVSRGHPGCRNIDLCASATRPGRYLVVEKWESAADQRNHFDSAEMVEMAESCRGLLARPPEIDLLEPITAHDLR